MSEHLRSFSLFRLVEDALADIGEVGKIRRMIPIAWPILEVEHRLKIRLEERLNLVERHVLEAIARFGPVPDAQIADWMGLDPSILQHVVTVLDRFPGVIFRKGNLLSASDDTLERCVQDRWGREILQSQAFFVNGPTGQLAPNSLNLVPAKYLLRVEFTGGTGNVVNSTGKNLGEVYWVAPSLADARQELITLVQGIESQRRLEVGVPEGAFQVDSTHGQHTRERWILTLGGLDEDGRFVVRVAGRPEMILLSVEKSKLQQLEPMLRRGDRTALGLFNLKDSDRTEKEIAAGWQEHAWCEAKGSKLTIRLKRPDTFDHWQGELQDPDETDSAQSPHSDALLPYRLWTTVGRPYIWHPYHFTVRMVEPGDKATAEVMMKHRALAELEKMADSEDNSLDLAAWWMSKQEKMRSAWIEEVRPPEIPLSDLAAIARRSPNPDIVNFIIENL
jgi:hypothetical protein